MPSTHWMAIYLLHWQGYNQRVIRTPGTFGTYWTGGHSEITMVTRIGCLFVCGCVWFFRLVFLHVFQCFPLSFTLSPTPGGVRVYPPYLKAPFTYVFLSFSMSPVACKAWTWLEQVFGRVWVSWDQQKQSQCKHPATICSALQLDAACLPLLW